MLKRTITGACYVAIIVAFFLLRQLVDYRLFHIIPFAFVVIGTYEMAKMARPFSLKGNLVPSVIYSVILIPLYLLFEYFVKENAGWIIALDFIALAVIVVTAVCLIKNVDKKTYFSTVAPYVYPALFLLPMVLMNELGEFAFIALLLFFVTSPICDTMAYLVGSLIGGKKLCPELSPKKTWSGAIGGLVGGIIGGILVFIIFRPEIVGLKPVLTAIIFSVVGLVSALLTETGDLFESFIKRRYGVKDSGNILPGHGGVLDRIDGMLFAGVFIYIIFLII
ncbi:MAG: CDP-archaeol synthase [Clostridia bacterium]|nr:CDP-archaeol synthase [Clostridia bacterium]